MNSAPSTLLRRPAPPAPRAAVPEPHVTITGALLADAYASTEPATGRVAFTVTLTQGGDLPDIVATRWVGDGHDAGLYAHERANGLSAGDIVTVHAAGMRMRYNRGAVALVLVGVRDIELQRRP